MELHQWSSMSQDLQNEFELTSMLLNVLRTKSSLRTSAENEIPLLVPVGEALDTYVPGGETLTHQEAQKLAVSEKELVLTSILSAISSSQPSSPDSFCRETKRLRIKII